MAPLLDPGWYRDPAHALRHRYWSGEAWHDEAGELMPELPLEARERRAPD